MVVMVVMVVMIVNAGLGVEVRVVMGTRMKRSVFFILGKILFGKKKQCQKYIRQRDHGRRANTKHPSRWYLGWHGFSLHSSECA